MGIAPLPSYIGEPDDALTSVLPGVVSVERTYWTVVPRELTGLARVKVVDEFLRSVVTDEQHLFAVQQKPQ